MPTTGGAASLTPLLLAAVLPSAGLSTAVLLDALALMPPTALRLPAGLSLLVCLLATLLTGLSVTPLSTPLSTLLHSSLTRLSASLPGSTATLLGLLAATLVRRVAFLSGRLLGVVPPVLLWMLMWLLGRALLAAPLALLLIAILLLGPPGVLATAFAILLSVTVLSTSSLAAPISLTHYLVMSDSRRRSWSGRTSGESDW